MCIGIFYPCQYSLLSNLSSQQLSYSNNRIDFQLHHFLAEFFDYIYFMGWSTNEKALAKKNKEKQEKTQKEQKKVQEAENKKWKDQESDKKMASQRQKEEKRLREIVKKQQLKELAEKQERQLQKINKKKQNFAEKKLTQADIAKNIEERGKKEKAENNHHKVYFEDNPNQAQDFQAVSSVEQALRVLDVEQEKHPEKRYKAAFEAYCSKREIQIRVEYPKLKRSQRMQMMHKQFQKHSDNPFNKNVVAYNDKTRKQAKKAKEEQKKQKQKSDEQKIEEKREEEDE